MPGVELSPERLARVKESYRGQKHRYGCKSIREVRPLRLSPNWVQLREIETYWWEVEWLTHLKGYTHDCIPVCRECHNLMIVQKLKVEGIREPKRKKKKNARPSGQEADQLGE